MVKKIVRKLWNLWTSLVGELFLIILAGSIVSGTLGLPTWIGNIPAGTGTAIVVGWFVLVFAVLSIITTLWDFFTKK